MERIFKAAKEKGYDVFISPHYFYPTDITWKMNGPLEQAEFENGSFARAGVLNLTGFTNSGADWLERFKPYENQLHFRKLHRDIDVKRILRVRHNVSEISYLRATFLPPFFTCN